MSAHARAEELLEPHRYLSQMPGKEVRAKLIDAFQIWLQIPEDRTEPIKKIIQKLHTASLLIDDIEDNSKLRRGAPVAHTIYGVPLTINCANYVMFLALEECNKLDNPAATQAFIAELLNLHRGQGFDILWRDTNSCPTEEQYKEMVIDKTGGMFRLSISLMQAFSDNKTDFSPLANAMALYFQIRDDYVNMKLEEYMVNKSYCEDLTEGKFSFPIIHSIRSQPNDHRLLNILKQRTEDRLIKQYAVEYLQSTGSFDYTLAALTQLKSDVMRELSKLGGNPILEAVMDQLHSALGKTNTVDIDEEKKHGFKSVL
eukprot:GILK01008213.1.p1 GENE.GILK01008213.1~~GILK01008213.1.p1  ORF type:complete len:314 (+),score=45.68 GILK01008213.1:34-975(+)